MTTTRELSPQAIDYWVAKARAVEVTRDRQSGVLMYDPGHGFAPRRFSPTIYWSQGGPIIDEAHIDLNWDTEGNQLWAASMEPDILAHGNTALEAAMRVYVIAKLGEQLGEPPI